MVLAMPKKLLTLIYSPIVYNYRLKRIIVSLLSSPLVYKNPLYLYFYQRFCQAKIKQYASLPFRLMIENTNLCSADCVFCPHQKMRRKRGIMSMALFKKIIGQAKKYKIDFVTIYGFGEPLLDPNFFAKIKLANQAAIKRISTNTNAMYLDQKAAQKILNSGLDEIYISFDASQAKTYRRIRPGLDFQTVEKNILNLIKQKKTASTNRPEIILSFVKTEINEPDLASYLKKWQAKVDHISISSAHNWTGALKIKIKPGRRDPCRLLWTDMVISWNGDVPLCCNDYENKIILGNIKRQTIKQIWDGKKLKKIRNLHLKGQFKKISLCQKCQYNYHHKSPWWISK